MDLETEIKTLFWAISIITMLTTSLLAVLVAPLPDFSKGVISGALLSTYVWVSVLVFRKYVYEE